MRSVPRGTTKWSFRLVVVTAGLILAQPACSGHRQARLGFAASKVERDNDLMLKVENQQGATVEVLWLPRGQFKLGAVPALSTKTLTIPREWAAESGVVLGLRFRGGSVARVDFDGGIAPGYDLTMIIPSNLRNARILPSSRLRLHSRG